MGDVTLSDDSKWALGRKSWVSSPNQTGLTSP